MFEISFSTHGGAGDIICLISAAHTYARITGAKVYVDHFPDVIESYRDGLVGHGHKSLHKHVDIYDWHRKKDASEHCNYLGTFIRAILPGLDLPRDFEFPPCPEEPKRCLIQPQSNFASNPDKAYLQRLVDDFTARTGQKLYVVGDRDTRQFLFNVDYSLLETSIPAMMGHIANAQCVLTPRSLSAHLAAGYKIPTLVWLPDDGENWHLDYPGWSHYRCGLATGQEAALDGLLEHL